MVRIEPGQPAFLGAGARLDLPPLQPGVVHQLATRGIEAVADGHQHVLVRHVQRGVTGHDEFSSGHGQVDPHVVEAPLAVVSMRGLQRNAATNDVWEVPLQPRQFAADRPLDGGAGPHAAQRDLRRQAHRTGLGPPGPLACGRGGVSVAHVSVFRRCRGSAYPAGFRRVQPLHAVLLHHARQWTSGSKTRTWARRGRKDCRLPEHATHIPRSVSAHAAPPFRLREHRSRHDEPVLVPSPRSVTVTASRLHRAVAATEGG